MKKKSGEKNNNSVFNKTISLSIILNLLLAFFAFSMIMGGMGRVEGQDATANQILQERIAANAIARDRDAFLAEQAKLATTQPTQLRSVTDPKISAQISNTAAKPTLYNVPEGTTVTTQTSRGLNIEAPIDQVRLNDQGQYVGRVSRDVKFGPGEGQSVKAGDEIVLSDAKANEDGLQFSGGKDGGTIVKATRADPAANTVEYDSPLGKLGTGTGNYALSNILSGLQTSLFVVGAIQLIGNLAGVDSALTSSLSISAFSGIMGAQLYKTAFVGNDAAISTWSSTQSNAPTWVGIGITIIMFIATYESTSEQKVSFECNLWQPPRGGADCEKCNVDGKNFPCNEYRCRSLGAACELLNEGTGEEKCSWINSRDVESPTISPNYQNISSGYQYANVHIRPPGLGMEIKNQNTENNEAGCIEAFYPITFGITTNEPTSCKIDYNHTKTFDEMQYYLGGSSTYKYNHTQTLSLPRPESNSSNINDPGIKNDGNYNLFLRCSDPNGNYNEDEFAIKFCVNAGPDTTPAKIETTSLINGMPITYNTDKLNITVYTNEPADCKWSKEDKDYNVMENSMTCSQSASEFNANMFYTCRGQLTGIKDRTENKFYFRCKDQPGRAESERNVNTQSYEFKVVGTQALNIIKLGPNGTIMGSTSVVPVDLQIETGNGYRDGEATCYYSRTGNENDYVKFFDTGNFIHRQRQELTAGTYDYFFKCVDLGGNADYNKTRIRIEIDEKAPTIIRAKHDSGESSICGSSGCLQIITNEESTCTYSTNTCNYEINNGIKMSGDKTKTHYAEWNTNYDYYIKCSDNSGNEPATTACSMIVKGYNKK